MEGSKLVLIAGRLLQLLCACVVLGTCADLADYFDGAKIQEALDLFNLSLDGLVPILKFGIFVGAWGLIDSLVGLAATFLEAIPWIVVAALDGLACIFYFAGGVAAAAWLNEGDHDSCTQVSKSKCTEGEAAAAFQFIGFVVTLVLLVLGFMWQRRGRK